LSGRWPTLLIYYLKDGTKRFSDLRRDNPTVSHRILTLELRKLEKAGIVERTVFDGYPLRVEYDLTPRRPYADAAGRCAGRLVGGARRGAAGRANENGHPGGGRFVKRKDFNQTG
jgi:DNA-binding transcriptional ArsR family regulator